MNSLTDLFDILQSQPLTGEPPALDEDRYSALYYATLLLRALRANKDRYRIERYHCPGNRFISDISDALREPVEAFFAGGNMIARTPQQHNDGLQPLLTLLRNLNNGSPAYNTPLILARATVVTIDRTALADVAMMQFKRYYADPAAPHGMRALEADDPVPTCFGIFGKHIRRTQGKKQNFGTNPQNLPVWRNPDRVPNAVLAPPQVADFEVVLNFDFEKELRDVQLGSTIVATFHPTKSLERDISFGFDQDNLERFFHVRTRCVDDDENPNPHKGPAPFATRRALQEQLAALMKRAAEAGAKLFIFPELMLDERDVSFIYDAWNEVLRSTAKVKTRHQRPQLMIPGSWHLKTGTPRRYVNRTEVWGRGRRSQTERGPKVEKIVPYAHRLGRDYADTDASATLSDDNMVEQITTSVQPQVILFCCENATMLVMICVDFLLDSLRDLARDLYASVVVIPSMSQKMRIFRDLMVGHVAATEAVIVFLNTLEPTDDAHKTLALVQHPDPDNVISVDSKSVRNLGSRRGAAILDLDATIPRDRVKWVNI